MSGPYPDEDDKAVKHQHRRYHATFCREWSRAMPPHQQDEGAFMSEGLEPQNVIIIEGGHYG